MPGGVVGFAETPAHAAVIETEAAPIARLTESATIPVVTVKIVLVSGRVPRAPAALPTSESRRLIGAVEGA